MAMITGVFSVSATETTSAPCETGMILLPAGDFSCADLLKVTVKMQDIWSPSAAEKQNQGNVEAALAVLTEQTATFTQLDDPEKDNVVRVEWIDDCDNTVVDCADDCIITGTESQATCKDYEISICKETSYTINDRKFRKKNVNFQEVLAKGWGNKLRILDEEIAKTVVAKVDSFAGVNPYATGIGDVVGNETYIEASMWTSAVMAYFAQVAILNKSNDVYLLDGDNLFQTNWIAQFNSLNANQASDAPMLATIRTYFDLFNMNAVLAPDKKTFMIDRGAVALVNKVRFPSVPEQILNGADVIRWSIPSNRLPGVMYDVLYKTECVNGGDILHKYKFIARFDVFLNPVSACDANNTGVLSFTCGEAPVLP